ncbi:MAG: Lrp/AsnC ligand binding domain-containing protein [Candidatus Bathyarchaeia archaeon]
MVGPRMLTAFLLITVKAGTDEVVVERLRKVNRIAEVHEIYGAYDILARVAAENADEIQATKAGILLMEDVRGVEVVNVLREWMKEGSAEG